MLQKNFGEASAAALAFAKTIAAFQLPNAGVGAAAAFDPIQINTDALNQAIQAGGESFQNGIDAIESNFTRMIEATSQALDQMSQNVDARISRFERGNFTARIGYAQGAVTGLS